MKAKIVIKVQLSCQKCKTKALEVAAATTGVTSVSFEGKEKDELVVIGDDVDPICLTSALRKKIRSANIVSVQEVKNDPKPPPNPKPNPPSPSPPPPTPPCSCPFPCYCRHPCYGYVNILV